MPDRSTGEGRDAGTGHDAVSVFLSYTVIGITTGAIYAITASGLVITYTTTGIFNFAQGAVGMIAAFSFWQLWQGWGWNPVLSLALVLLVLAPLLAIVVEVVFMRRLHGASTVRSLMVTLGLLVILVGRGHRHLEPPGAADRPPVLAGQGRDHPRGGGQLPADPDRHRGRGRGRGHRGTSSGGSGSAWPCGPSSTTRTWWPWPGPSPTGSPRWGGCSASSSPPWPAASSPRPSPRPDSTSTR